MLELLYGAKDFDRIAWKEIDEGRPVALRVVGPKKARIHHILSLYDEYDRASRNGVNRRSSLWSFGWRAILAPSIIGLCNHARLAGMSIVVLDKGSTLEVKFEKPFTAKK
jgi:hypothetical protein